MNILQMSFSASILILAIIVIRALAINKLPKKTFLAFWAIALVRLLIPFSFPSPFSLYSFISNNASVTDTIAGTPVANIIPMLAPMQMPTSEIVTTPASPPTTMYSLSLWIILWIAGVTLCAIFFLIAYVKCYKGFQASTIIQNDFITAWLAEHKIVRPISIKQSNRILSPLTYGIFRPIILLPQKLDWSDEKQLHYILAHEYAHIRRFDTVTKLFLTAALCIHWFNPLVWAMYILSNRDIELSCDESVVRLFGETIKSSYARILVSMEEKKSSFNPYYNSFSKNAIEERIIAIMKIKRTSLIAVLVAVAMVAGVTTVFATSATAKNNELSSPSIPEITLSDNNTTLNSNPITETKIGNNYRSENGNETASYSKKVSFDIQTIKVGENVQLGGYMLQKGDTVQIDYESSGNDISILMFIKNDNATLQTAKNKISIGTAYEISQQGDYYFSIQSDASNGTSANIKGSIQFNYKTPQIVQDENIQFTDDEVNPNTSQSIGNIGVPPQQTASNVGASENETIDSNKSPYDGMFDDNSTVLQYFNKNSYTADNYQEDGANGETSLIFTKFSGSKAIYTLNLEQASTINFRITADVDGEYKIAFITENNEVIMKASSYNGIPASRPIDIPKGRTTIVLIGEQATGTCNIMLND